MKKSFTFSAVTALGMLAAAANAATMSHTLTAVQAYNSAGTSLGTTSTIINNAIANATPANPVYIRLSINSVLGSLGADEAYGNELVDLTFSGGAARFAANVGSARPNYLGFNGPAGFNDSGTQVQIMQSNADQGPSSTDLKALTPIINNDSSYNNVFDDASQSNQIADPRTTFATGAGSRIGTIDVKWDGSANGWVTLQNASYSTLTKSTKAFGLSNDIPNGTQPNGDPVTGSASFFFQAVPEPASMSLVGLGVFTAAFRRRRMQMA